MSGPYSTRPVFLIGFMGAGKTSAGKALARRLNWKFFDLDDLIEQYEQASVAVIFSRVGESGFRQIESAVLWQLLEMNHQNSVIALGGGTFVQSQNRDLLSQAGAITVLLDAPVEELARRCEVEGGGRPLAQDKEKFNQLFASRREAYELARFRIQTAGKTVENVAAEIEELLMGLTPEAGETS